MIWLVATALAGPVILPRDAVDEVSAARALTGRRLALLVGPSAFDDPAFVPLRFTDDDALELAQTLSDPDLGRFDEVWTLTERPDTTVAGVRAAMAELGAQTLSRDDTVVVYFSTHGTLVDEGGHLFQELVLSDTRLAAARQTGLEVAEVTRWMDALPSRRKLLVLATCHSGSGKSALTPGVTEALASIKGPPTLEEVSEATMVLSACAWSETARESAELGHDVYTAFLLDALITGDLDGDGAVTASEAHETARRATWEFTAGAQRPQAVMNVLGADPIVLSGQRGPAESATIGSWSRPLTAYELAVDGVSKGALPGVSAIAPGPHAIEVRRPDGGLVARQHITARAGSQIDVQALMRRDLGRLGVGVGYLGDTAGIGGPTLEAELHAPRLLPVGWDATAHGGFVVAWPYTSVMGGLAAERILRPGAVQLRAGAGLEGGFLSRGGDEPLLAPTLVPAAVASVLWLPPAAGFVRMSVTGAPLWWTDGGDLHGGGMVQVRLVAGLAPPGR